MNTSATPAAGNPNPAAGTIIVQFADNFNRILGLTSSVLSPVGTPVAVDATNLTPGVAYVITTLGATTAANWVALGVPPGVTPAVGVAFIALVSGAGADTTARVAPSAAAGSGIFAIEGLGDGNVYMANFVPSANQGYGFQAILQCRNASGGSSASAIAAPANNSAIQLSFYMSNSSVLLQGE